MFIAFIVTPKKEKGSRYQITCPHNICYFADTSTLKSIMAEGGKYLHEVYQSISTTFCRLHSLQGSLISLR